MSTNQPAIPMKSGATIAYGSGSTSARATAATVKAHRAMTVDWSVSKPHADEPHDEAADRNDPQEL